jgi:hypothetical protein
MATPECHSYVIRSINSTLWTVATQQIEQVHPNEWPKLTENIIATFNDRLSAQRYVDALRKEVQP